MDTDTVMTRDGRDSWAKHVNWWLLLLGPLAATAAVFYSRFDPDGFQRLQTQLEEPAPYLMAFVALLYAIRATCARNRLFVLLSALAVAFTLREFHFDWMHHTIYWMLAALGIWALLWRKHLARPLRDFRHTSWLIATCGAYVLSQAIARRAFRFVPNEQIIHRSWEEVAETVAHVMLIATSLVGSWGREQRPLEPGNVCGEAE